MEGHEALGEGSGLPDGRDAGERKGSRYVHSRKGKKRAGKGTKGRLRRYHAMVLQERMGHAYEENSSEDRNEDGDTRGDGRKARRRRQRNWKRRRRKERWGLQDSNHSSPPYPPP